MHPETSAQTNPTVGGRTRRATTQRVSLLALVPLHQFFIRGFTLVVPLQTEGFLAKNRGLETSPRLNLKVVRSEEHTSELQSQSNLVCRLLLEKKKQI